MICKDIAGKTFEIPFGSALTSYRLESIAFTARDAVAIGKVPDAKLGAHLKHLFILRLFPAEKGKKNVKN